MIKWLKNWLFPEYEEPQRVEIQPISERFPISDDYRIKKELEEMKAFLSQHAPGILQSTLINRVPGVMGTYEMGVMTRDAVQLAEELRKQIGNRVKDEHQELERIFAKARFERNVGDYNK